MERSDGRCLLCSICYVTLPPQSPSPSTTLLRLPLSLSLSHLALSFSFLLLLLLPLAPLSRTFSLSHVFSFHLSTNLSSPSLSPPPSCCSFVVRCSLQVRANPPSYIQQTPSIYSFELDGSKGKVAGCCSVNFRPLKYLVSSLPPSLAPSVFIPCSFALIYRFEKRREGGDRAPAKKNR